MQCKPLTCAETTTQRGERNLNFLTAVFTSPCAETCHVVRIALRTPRHTYACYCSAAMPIAYPPLPAHDLSISFRNGCPGPFQYFLCSCNSLFSTLDMGGETASSIVRRLFSLNMPFGGSASRDVPLPPLSLFWELLCFLALASADIPDLLSERIQITCRETSPCEEGSALGSVMEGPRQRLAHWLSWGKG